MQRPPKNPFALPAPALTPPGHRSRPALGLAAAAARGRFALQVCTACATVQYPPREACHTCLGTDLPWRDIPPGGRLTAHTTIRVSADPYFRAHLPWRAGLVAMDAGPQVVAHLHANLAPGDRVRLALRLDKAGAGVMLALPEEGPVMPDDPILRETGSDPHNRRVLISDARHPAAPALVRAFRDAGALEVFAGLPEAWRPHAEIPGATLLPLDATDQHSTAEAAAAIAGRIEIMVDTSWRLRPGGPLDQGALTEARAEMESAYFARLRLAQAFGPAMQARAGDGPHAPCAWISLVSIAGLLPTAGHLRAGPAQSAALALARSLRPTLRPLRVLTALIGPLDDAWHAALPPPKLNGAQIATALIRALRDGREEIAIGDIAADALARYLDHPGIALREFT
jgi:uncharacterized OB-fold protein/NAD(P)-dependent dehydrogenase (short-subunit alcohol dehydrogenase family)